MRAFRTASPSLLARSTRLPSESTETRQASYIHFGLLRFPLSSKALILLEGREIDLSVKAFTYKKTKKQVNKLKINMQRRYCARRAALDSFVVAKTLSLRFGEEFFFLQVSSDSGEAEKALSLATRLRLHL